MRIADLRDLIVIQSVTQARDSFGAVTESWANTLTVWANVKALKYSTGLESVVNTQGREVVTPSYTMTIRYRTDVSERQRVVWNGQTFDIRRIIDPTGRKEYMELYCELMVL